MTPRILWLLALLLPGWLLGPSAAFAGEPELVEALTLLQQKSFTVKQQAVGRIAASDDPRARGLLQALLDGELYHLKRDRRLVVAPEVDGAYQARDALSGEPITEIAKRDLKKIPINNRMRGALKGAIAALSLGNRDAAVRLDAVRQMMRRLDAEDGELLRGYLEKEHDDDVRGAMEEALALLDLGADDEKVRLAAVEHLAGSLEPAARNRLVQLADHDPAAAVKRAAVKAVQNIDGKRDLYGLVETLFFGLSLGSVLVLAAIGLAITFGVMGVINMAHGELIMIGAYTTYVVQLMMPNHIGVSLLVAVPAAFIVSGLFGIAIERGVIRFLYGRPLETLLATFGISLVLQQLVRSVFSPLNRSVATPDWMSGSIQLNSVLSLTLNRLYIVAFCLLVFAALFYVLRRTPLGLQVRAVSQNRAMARAMGVRASWVDAMTFGLGSGIAGVAGVALSQLTNVGPNLGQAYIIDSFMVVVFGGVGNLWGTLVAGLSLGVANKVMEPWAGAVLAKILVLVFIILFIQKRPRGLFPQKGRAAEG
ncbi:urea ABC transporter permease subunit UrtB [Endothiovibrio diazotrophicus]